MPKKKKAHRKRESSTSSSDWEEASPSTHADLVEPSESSQSGCTEEKMPKRPDFGDFLSTIDEFARGRDKPSAYQRQAREQEAKKTLAEREFKSNSDAVRTRVHDGGSGWLLRALQRAKEQSQREGRPLEEIASERWGSLSKLEEMLEQAGVEKPHQLTRPTSTSDSRPSNGASKYGSTRGSSQQDHERKQPRQVSNERRSEFRRRVSPPGGDVNQRQFQRRKSRSPDVAPTWGGKRSSKQKTAKPEKSVDVDWSAKRNFVTGETVNPSGAQEGEPNSSKTNTQDACQVSQAELNRMNAKIVKAELRGDTAAVEKLRSQLAEMKNGGPPKSQQAANSDDLADDVVLLTTTNPKTGLTMPVREARQPEETTGPVASKKRKTLTETLEADTRTLRELVEDEKMTTALDQNILFADLAKTAENSRNDDRDFNTVDDVFANQRMRDPEKTADAAKKRAIGQHQKRERILADCRFCIDSAKLEKHLVIATGLQTYLALPASTPLSQGHCLVVPFGHVGASTLLDEDVYAEIRIWIKGLTALARSQDRDLVILETVINLERDPHLRIECVPLPSDVGNLAPMYFKKAILECEGEWLQNKRLVELKPETGGARKAIPKGFPYFAVEFGTDGGFAHVIEHERSFPVYFGKEILGGMLELDDPQIYRRPKPEKLAEQMVRVTEFVQQWKPFDWTEKVKMAVNS